MNETSDNTRLVELIIELLKNDFSLDLSLLSDIAYVYASANLTRVLN